MRSYALRVTTGSKDKQEKQLTRPVPVPREFYDRFRELIWPLQCFMSTIPMQVDEFRGVGVLGRSAVCLTLFVSGAGGRARRRALRGGTAGDAGRRQGYSKDAPQRRFATVTSLSRDTMGRPSMTLGARPHADPIAQVGGGRALS